MKKAVLFIVLIAMLFCYNVHAKDTFKTINKYKEESLDIVIDGYDKENRKDGLVVAGTYTKEKDDVLDTQVTIVKYNYNGKKIWNYDYGKTDVDKLYCLSYTYNENKEIDGYLIVVDSTKDVVDSVEVSPIFIKIDLNGKEVSEKALGLLVGSNITKIINIEDGYIIVGSTNNGNKNIGFISKYDKNLDRVWMKNFDNNDYSSVEINDIVSFGETGNYAIIESDVNDSDGKYLLKIIDANGNVVSTIKEDFDYLDNPKLIGLNDSYIVYGYNYNVKFDNEKNIAYYVLKYNDSNEIEWESLSKTPVSDLKPLSMYPVFRNNKLDEYLMMSTNDNDSSVEITKINLDGEIKNKIKKINNAYYDIHSFAFSDDILYFVGQINCPDDDNCDYNNKSLFLISTEDKVIEVKEDDNKTIIIISGIIIILTGILYVLRKISKAKE